VRPSRSGVVVPVTVWIAGMGASSGRSLSAGGARAAKPEARVRRVIA
jgi:hypothetical protein